MFRQGTGRCQSLRLLECQFFHSSSENSVPQSSKIVIRAENKRSLTVNVHLQGTRYKNQGTQISYPRTQRQEARESKSFSSSLGHHSHYILFTLFKKSGLRGPRLYSDLPLKAITQSFPRRKSQEADFLAHIPWNMGRGDHVSGCLLSAGSHSLWEALQPFS